MERDIAISEGPSPKYGMEETYISREAFDQLKELGAIDDHGRLMPDEVLRNIDVWQIICATVGRLHG